MPVAITIGIVAMAICFLYIKNQEKQLIQKIANYEAIAQACRRTDAQLIDQLPQSFSIEKLNEMMKAVDDLCILKKENNFFGSIDNGAKDLRNYYNLYLTKKNNLDAIIKAINSTLKNLKKDIQDLQQTYENLALKL